MVDRENLIDFFARILDGIGYGKLSKTNRAYSWMRGNNTFEGPCLNFLKENITGENLLTVKELNLFTELQKAGNLPSESEIDEALSEYLSDDPIHFQNMNLPALHHEVSESSKYCDALEAEEKILKQLCSKLQGEVSALETRQKMNSNQENTILQSVTKTNTIYNNLSSEIQCDLMKITRAFTTLLHNNIAAEERNLFRMNFDTFRKINYTFRDSVDTAIRRHFNKVKKRENDIHKMQVTDNDQVEVSISVAQSLGQYNYQHLKWQCEETELNELTHYIENVLEKFDFKNISIVRLKSLMDADMVSTYEVQKKIMHLAEVLEKFHSDYVVRKMLLAYRKQTEHRMKSDYKFLRKISDICTKFVDLMTLQACLFHREKENIDMVVAVCDLSKLTLDEHTRRHSMTVTKLKRMLKNRESCEESNQSYFSNESKVSCSTLIIPDDCDSVNVIQDKILRLVSDHLSNYFAVEDQLHELNDVIFSGPARQIFFCDNLHNDESLVKQQYDHFSNQYKLWRSQYNEILEKTNVTEVEKLKKTLGLMFLTNPKALRSSFEQWRNIMLENRSKCSRTLTVAPVNSSTYSQIDLKKGNLSTI